MLSTKLNKEKAGASQKSSQNSDSLTNTLEFSRKQTGHTPGPWSFDDSHGYGLIHVAESADQNEPVVCEMYCSDFIDSTTIRANARLIAAAPELLEALKAALPIVDDAYQDAHNRSGYKTVEASFYLQIGAIKAAIAKAEGGLSPDSAAPSRK